MLLYYQNDQGQWCMRTSDWDPIVGEFKYQIKRSKRTKLRRDKRYRARVRRREERARLLLEPKQRNAREIAAAYEDWLKRYNAGQLNQQFYNKMTMHTLDQLTKLRYNNDG